LIVVSIVLVQLSVVGFASLPYHAVGLFMPATEFGAKYASVTFGPLANYYVPEIVLGYQGTPPTLSQPLTFPCQGTSGIDYESAKTESEMPLGIDTGTSPIGTVVTVMSGLADTVVLTTGVMTAPDGSVISLKLLDSSKDASLQMPQYAATAFPASPLRPNTSYGATITGTVNGTAFSRSFTFTTGNQGQF
jgi:hypothetical protein